MQFKQKDSNQAVLQKLWGRNIPPLTSEEVELSVQVWQKINARKQRERNYETSAQLK